MATAPTPTPLPGSAAERDAARQFMRMTVKGRTLDMVPALTMREKFVVRAATGLPFEAFMPAENDREFASDSMFVCYWLGRRQNGEPNLPFATALEEWPDTFEPGDLDFTIIDLDDEPVDEDTPEGSGPAS